MKLITILTYYSRNVPSLPVIHLPRVDPYYFVSFNSNFPSIDLFSLRVSMGLTDRRKTVKNLVDSRKNWKILTVNRK